MAEDRCDLLCLDLPRAEAIRARLDPDAAEVSALRAKALGDPTRMLIALALRDLPARVATARSSSTP